MRDLPQRRPTYLLKRGAYDAPTVPVFPQTPAVFPPLPDDAPRNRLGLAQWLTDPGHPLTAEIADLTGLTDRDLAGRSIDEDQVTSMLASWWLALLCWLQHRVDLAWTQPWGFLSCC